MKRLNQKLATENAIIMQADKGKTIVIINSEDFIWVSKLDSDSLRETKN
jgi:hypothetical protein